MSLTQVPGCTISCLEGCVDFEQAFEYQGIGAVSATEFAWFVGQWLWRRRKGHEWEGAC
jgi:hypothetical protein